MVIYLTLAILIAGAAFIRLAPSDPLRWHIDPGTVPVTGCTDLTKTRSSARVSCLRDIDPESLLSQLDTIALATPRTTRLAGSAESGRITWLTRSALFGFPDYTTAQTTPTPDGTRLDLFARLRFGGFDQGVNAVRLGKWLSAL